MSYTRLLTDKQFRALLDLYMCADPYPDDNEENHEIITQLINEESLFLGYKDWVEAYHEFGA